MASFNAVMRQMTEMSQWKIQITTITYMPTTSFQHLWSWANFA